MSGGTWDRGTLGCIGDPGVLGIPRVFGTWGLGTGCDSGGVRVLGGDLGGMETWLVLGVLADREIFFNSFLTGVPGPGDLLGLFWTHSPRGSRELGGRVRCLRSKGAGLYVSLV